MYLRVRVVIKTINIRLFTLVSFQTNSNWEYILMKHPVYPKSAIISSYKIKGSMHNSKQHYVKTDDTETTGFEK